MDSEKIRGLLAEYAAQKWKALAQPLLQLKFQLDMMDEHQEKLSHLLDVNGADALANTEDILSRVEQYLCKNVRKVLNYLGFRGCPFIGSRTKWKSACRSRRIYMPWSRAPGSHKSLQPCRIQKS